MFVVLTILVALLVLMDVFTDFPISPVNEILLLLAYVVCVVLEIGSFVMKRKKKNVADEQDAENNHSAG